MFIVSADLRSIHPWFSKSDWSCDLSIPFKNGNVYWGYRHSVETDTFVNGVCNVSEFTGSLLVERCLIVWMSPALDWAEWDNTRQACAQLGASTPRDVFESRHSGLSLSIERSSTLLKWFVDVCLYFVPWLISLVALVSWLRDTLVVS